MFCINLQSRIHICTMEYNFKRLKLDFEIIGGVIEIYVGADCRSNQFDILTHCEIQAQNA